MSSPTSPTDAHRRNTNNVDGVESHRSRSWFFTLNNYTVKECAQLPTGFSQYSAKKYIFQEEIGENKTAHLQGIVTFKEKVSFKNMKKLNSRAHWEVPKNTQASYNYCQKTETRKPNGMRWIYPPTNDDKLTNEELNQGLYTMMIDELHNSELGDWDPINGFYEVAKPKGITLHKAPWYYKGSTKK